MIPEFPTAPIERALRRGRGRGFTLIEALTASVVLTILVLGMVGALNAAYQQSQATSTNSTAIVLAGELTEEIVSKPYSSSDSLGSGGVRSTFTNVSAYNGYTDASNAIPLLEGGASVDATGSQVYGRSVSVSVGSQPSIDSVSPATDFAIVTVSVTCPNGQIVSVPEWVANYAIQSN
jgi:Tfp pilus assembly protein PilV